MRHTILIFSSLAIAASIGCASGGTASEEEGAPAASISPMQALLQPRGGGMSGEVNVLPTGRAGEFRVNMSLRGSAAGQQHPWHVHRGRCDAEGPVVGSILAYPVLAIRGDGNIDLTQTIREGLESGVSYYVDIHASRSNMDRILACGDLIPTAP